MKASRGMIPNEGWRYEQAIPGSAKPVQVKADNFDKLVEAVFALRVANNLPIGDVGRDIDRWLCDNRLAHCQPEASDFGLPPDVPREKPLADRVAEWVARMRHLRSIGLVPLKEAEARADICARCHRNRNWGSRCGACDDRVKHESALVRQLRPPTKYPLLGCEAAGWDNESAVNLDRETLNVTDSIRPVLPSNCWAK